MYCLKIAFYQDIKWAATDAIVAVAEQLCNFSKSIQKMMYLILQCILKFSRSKPIKNDVIQRSDTQPYFFSV